MASDLKNKNEVCVGPTSTQAGKASTCDGCPNQAECSSGKFADQKLKQQKENEEIMARLDSVKNILLVLSGKGGVGKSSVASQIAWSLAHWGLKVGILDIDICGPSIARMMGVENENVRPTSTGWTPVYTTNGYDNDDDDNNNDDYDEADDISLSVMSIAFLLQSKNDSVIWRGPRKTGLIKQFLCDVAWNELDFLIIDSPPGTSDEHISIQKYLSTIVYRQQQQQQEQCTQVHSVIVSTPQEVSLLDVRKELSFCNKVKLPVLGIIENMSYFICPCCDEKSNIFVATTGGVKQMCKDFNQTFLGALPIDPNLLKCCDQGIGYLKYWEDKQKKNQNTNNNNNNSSSDEKDNTKNNDNNNNSNNNNSNNDNNNNSNSNKKNKKESVTYSSIVNVIDSIMKSISSDTYDYVSKMRKEANERRAQRLQSKKTASNDIVMAST